jgi:hypothetical protein
LQRLDLISKQGSVLGNYVCSFNEKLRAEKSHERLPLMNMTNNINVDGCRNHAAALSCYH